MLTKTAYGYKIILVALFFVATISHKMAGAEEMNTSDNIIFTTVVYPTQWSEANTLLLIESIRAFAGDLSQAQIWCLVPQYGKELKTETVDRLIELGATLMPFDIDLNVARFFFAADIRAAQIAESTATGKTDFIAWLGSNTIILKEPKAFILEDDKSLGYRPVHHANIGSVYNTPLDPFWTLIYGYCDVPDDRVFPMETHIDGQTLRPYFNAGILITRPDRNLFKTWHDTFFAVYQRPDLQELYKKDERYVIFIHQALLSGIVLQLFSKNDLQALPSTYNYPVHLHDEDVTAHRPATMDDFVTFRHEGFYQDPEWKQTLPASDSLKQWLADKLIEQ
jgi:hypothetical protein